MAISPDEIAEALRKEIEGFETGAQQANVGTVLAVADGVATISGLSEAMAGELLQFPGGIMGMALNLEEDSVGAVILGRFPRDRGGRRGPHHRAGWRRCRWGPNCWGAS